MDVDKRLGTLEFKVDHHETLHMQNSETLKGVHDVLVAQAKISENQDNFRHFFYTFQQKSEDRFSLIEEKLSKHQEKIMYWSGGIAVIAMIATVVLSVLTRA